MTHCFDISGLGFSKMCVFVCSRERTKWNKKTFEVSGKFEHIFHDLRDKLVTYNISTGKYCTLPAKKKNQYIHCILNPSQKNSNQFESKKLSSVT